MASELRLTGVDELLRELIRLAPDLAEEAGALQSAIAQETAANVRAAYPAVTGDLRASVQVQRESSASPVRVFTRVAVLAPYASYFEFGTVNTPPRPTFIPLSNDGRREFLNQIIARVRAHGLTVSGNV